MTKAFGGRFCHISVNFLAYDGFQKDEVNAGIFWARLTFAKLHRTFARELLSVHFLRKKL